MLAVMIWLEQDAGDLLTLRNSHHYRIHHVLLQPNSQTHNGLTMSYQLIQVVLEYQLLK